LRDIWKYNGPVFDAHTHIGSKDDNSGMIELEEEYGISAQIGIVHDEEGFKATRTQYPDRFVFAKYLNLSDIAQFNVEPVLEEIAVLKEEGYHLAKTWFGPRWRDYYEVAPGFRIDHPKLEPVFQALEDKGIPFIIHVSDPDTYYANQYKDSEKYGSKEKHLRELENVISKHTDLFFQVPHFAAQPEIHRLPDLADWMEKYPNFVVDTASSRWMARELSKNVEDAREFMLRYADRVLFGTDLFARKSDDPAYYSGRYVAQRILWETSERHMPLPIPDPDTEGKGGTYINGLDLPLSALRKLYWENAQKIYMV